MEKTTSRLKYAFWPAIVASTLAGATAHAQTCEQQQSLVDIEWRPSFAVGAIGDTLNLDLYVVSSDGISNQAMAAIQVILEWDPAILELEGVDDTASPYDWLASFFPDDSGLDGLNAPFGDLPANDGDCMYNAWAQLLPPPFTDGLPFATPEGLLVTTFQFRILEATSFTELVIAAESGKNTETLVLSGIVPGCDIKGTFDAVPVRGTPIPLSPGDADEDGDVDLLDFGGLQRCSFGPEPALPAECYLFDLDLDLDVDLFDFTRFQASVAP
jgi:hypothetical protein